MPLQKLLSFNDTDAGNAEAFALLYGHRFRFDHTSGIWRTWNDDRLRSKVESSGLTAMSLVFDVSAAPQAVAAEIALEYV